ncbi:cytidylate kinase [Longibacter salinarum]|uniref:Cytidylate kinase n=1 Tax=Longibacter salinarum TaxID=1850348 RepID=A0A2A8D2K8_9BACT|nr:(d)CMP kinase [Longibacter salinarum]PEN15111.1 cytidylate kinase [Longibacter salinarum]
MIVTIDGPAGSGKSTTARAAADRLGFVYLDTGAMYRAIALAFIRRDAEGTPDEARAILPDVRVDIRYRDNDMRVVLDGEDVSGTIRTAEVGNMASQISALQSVREKLLDTQRRVGREQAEKHGGVVLDGRDTGTVVFPDADVKIFMVADARERARRRLEEYQKQGEDVTFESVLREIEERDEADRTREIAPLKRADDAVELDTTSRSIDEQVGFVVNCVKAELAQSA